MELLKRYFKLSLLLFIPLLLGAKEGGCHLAFHNFFSVCRSDLRYNAMISYRSLGWTYKITDNGIISLYRRVYPLDCVDFIVFTAPGSPSLNDGDELGDHSLVVVGDNGTIIRTTSGTNFEIINSPTSNNLVAIEGDRYYDFGVAVGNAGTIIRSNDYGLNWELVSFPELIDLKDVYLDRYDPNFITVVGEDLSLYLTFNGGVTWQHVPLDAGLDKRNGTLPTLNRIYHLDGLNAYLVGDFGTVIKTTDNFSTYNYVDLQSTENLTDVYFISPDSGLIVGANGTIRFTTNSGTDWFEDPEVTDLLESKNIKRMSAFDNDSLGVIIADSGFTIIVAKDSSYFTTSIESENEMPTEYCLSQNYPNPFNPSTKINYSVPEYGLVTIKVYDLLGNEVAPLVNEEKNAGNYEIEFNGYGLPSGVYFYKIFAGNFSETKKLVLIK